MAPTKNDKLEEDDTGTLIFFVNGKKIEEAQADPEVSLLSYIRTKLRLTGTKLGCGEGGCGACTVMVSKWDADSYSVIHYSVNACLAPVVSMHGCAVTTVEGIGSTKTRLHAVQERLARNHGSQCGFCTPGIVMSMYTLLRNKPAPTTEDIEMSLQGNLCRCTGYRPIIKAFNTFAKQSSCCRKTQCCRNGFENLSETVNGQYDKGEMTHEKNQFSKNDKTQEVIFPPELLILSRKNLFSQPIKFSGERVTWYKPTSLDQLTALKENFPDAHLVVGNTEVGIETWVKGRCYPIVVTPVHVKEISKIEVDDTGVTIGASCTFTQIRREFLKLVSKIGSKPTQPLSAILEMLYWFAGDQIRNVGALGGNIMTASPISDLNPIFMACESSATFKLHSRGERSVSMDQTFFPSYRKTAALKGEVLTQVRLPFTTQDEYMKAYMQSRRREDDIAIVNAAFKVSFHQGSDKVKKFVASFGGMAATSVMPQKTMKKMIDRRWNNKLLEDVLKWLGEELHLTINAPGGMVEYREALAASFFFKFYVYVFSQLNEGNADQSEILQHSTSSAITSLREEEIPFEATQTWQEVSKDQRAEDTVGRPIQHVSSNMQVTGEAIYVDDMPPYSDELYLALVTSSRAHARIINIDTEAASKVPGFVTWVDYHDIPGANTIFRCGEVLVQTEATCVGHVIGAVVADNHAHAQRAARLVEVTYEDLHPVIVTIEDAIKKNSFYKPSRRIVCGDVEAAMTSCDHVIEGEFRIGGQEHFYLETQVCLAIPKENNEMEIFASTQHPTMLQSHAAEILGVDSNKIHVRVKRLGGGFGGKETRFHVLANPVVIAANKCQRPVRCMLTRQEDMLITGGRHPFLAKYKVGFMKDGKIVALIATLYNNAGNTLDLSTEVMEKAILACDNLYRIPNVELNGYLCRTNVASNTAFRGFGSPQGCLVVEEWVSQVAAHLETSPEKVREINFYKENDLTYYGQRLEAFQGRKCWDECKEKAEFEKRKMEIENFNNNNRWKKKGISCIPVKFALPYHENFLNQAGALVLIYKDSSVLLTHGGTEMGQGLHTKMIQVASKCLGIPVSHIHISETSTNTVPNTSATAASASSDLNGMAVKNACQKILKRLKPLQDENPSLSWNELVLKAYMERISLSATGFYKVPDLHFNWDSESGKITGEPFLYFAYGAAVSEVEIDCLTGDHVVLRTDIVMDVGRSINPSVDIGQIEGAFVQGYGYLTLEESLHTPSGHLLARGPGAYKIPGFGDCPKQFNVHLLRNSANDKAVFSSKGVGEPPFFLATSVFFAIKHAIGSARKDSNLFGRFRIDSPATAERIRMACGDALTKQHTFHDDEKDLIPWAIQS